MTASNGSPTKNSNDSSAALARTTQAALTERARRQPDNLRVWAEAYRRIGGQPMVLPPALHAIYEDDHPFLVVRKPSQVGITELNINLALFSADSGYAGRGVALVVLPTGEMAERISQARFAKAINESPYLRRRAHPDTGPIKSPANVQRRSLGSGVVYFVGSEQESQFSGIDADVVICDEFDLMRPDTLALMQSRTRSSRAPRLIATSTPTIESFGVSALYDRSDARRYELQCANCESWQTPSFPDSVDWDRLAVVCRSCAGPLDPWRIGRWVSDCPEQPDIHGYQLNRLVLPNPPLTAMRLAMNGTLPTTRETFYRQDLGVPWISEDARLTLDDLQRCVGAPPFDPLAFHFTRVAMGVDVGKELHVVIRGFYEGRWYLIRAQTCDEFQELDQLLAQFKVSMCVVDAQPERRAVRDFYQRHPDKVRLCLYVQQGIAAHWDYVDGVGFVRVPRTLAMDDWLYQFKSGTFAVPENYRELAGGDYVKHLLAPVRLTVPDAFGQPVATFEHTRPDDFAHAEVYATLATTRCHDGGVFMIDFDGHRLVSLNRSPHPDLSFNT